MSVGTLSMAGGGFKFLLLTFQYLVGWGIFNLVISMNLFRYQQFENYQRRSPFRLSGGTRSRGIKNVTDLTPVR